MKAKQVIGTILGIIVILLLNIGPTFALAHHRPVDLREIPGSPPRIQAGSNTSLQVFHKKQPQQSEGTITLNIGDEREETPEFEDGSQIITYEVIVPAGSTLSVSVKDYGMEGDIWRAELFEGGSLLGTTQGDGSLEHYSSPASATIASGRAQVRISYVRGVDVWPAAMYVKFVCSMGEAVVTPTPDEVRRQRVVQTVITEVLRGETQGKEIYTAPEPLPPGTVVTGWTGDIHTAPTKEWMVFIDDNPMANWGHPARYVFVDYETEERRVQQALVPPLEFAEMGTVALPTKAKLASLSPMLSKAFQSGGTITLNSGDEREEHLEFQNGGQIITYEVVVPAGSTLSVSVKDYGMEGDIWRAELFEGERLVGTAQGDGSLEHYSSPASAAIASGRAQVRISYVRGVEVWPAHMYVKFASSAVPGPPCPGDVFGGTITLDTGEREEHLEFQCGPQIITYEVVVPAGSTLSVSVKDYGMEGDIWRAELFEGERLVGTAQGDGSLEHYSSPASAAIASGRAQVRISYVRGVEVWPAHMYVKFASSAVPGPPCPGDVLGGTITLDKGEREEYLEFQCGPHTITYEVVVPAGSTLSVSVKDYGMEGDIWRAELFEGERLVGTTDGDGSLERYSPSASATIASGRAQVRISYVRGVDVWPAHMYVKFASAGGAVVVTPTKYAVLISGGGNNGSNYNRYWNDISFMYRTLVQRYGYSDQNIFVIFADGTDPAQDQTVLPGHSLADSTRDLDGDGDDDIDYAATVANVKKVFGDLSKTLGQGDQLLVFATNHGTPTVEGTRDVSLVLYYNELVKDSEFAALVNPINAGSMIFVFEQCFSGGFVDNLSAPGRVVITAANWDEPSWGADTEGPYDEFVYHWTSAVRGATPTGTAVNADTDGNGVVSVKEAFNYATSNDSANEKPQYSEGSPGLGSQLSL